MGRKTEHVFKDELPILAEMARNKDRELSTIMSKFILDERTARQYQTIIDKCFDEQGNLTWGNLQYVESTTTIPYMIKEFSYDELQRLVEYGLMKWTISQAKFRKSVEQFKEALNPSKEVKTMDTTQGVLRPIDETDNFNDGWSIDLDRLEYEYPWARDGISWERVSQMVLFTNDGHAIEFVTNLDNGETFQKHYIRQDMKQTYQWQKPETIDFATLEIDGI